METEEVVQGSGSYDEMKAQLGIVDDTPKETPEAPPTDSEQPKVEEVEKPTEEAPQEEAPTEEAPTEAPSEAPTEEPKEETIFEVNDFNKLFESEFEDLDSVKAALASAKRTGELEK